MNLAPYEPPPRLRDTVKVGVICPLLLLALLVSPVYFAVGVCIVVLWHRRR